jgi:uncharacterized protein YndB with AHSA1/START domain
MIKKNAVRSEIIIHAAVEKVWNAMTVPEELNRWYTTECEIDFRVGGTIKMVHGWGAWTEGTITEIVEKERFVFRTGEDAQTAVTLEELGDDVKVTIEYRDLWIGDEGIGITENMAFGTRQFLINAKSVLEEGKDLRATFWPSWLGAFHTSIRPEHADRYGTANGTLVLNVSDQSPAKDGGLLPEDVITAVDDKKIMSYEDLEKAVWGAGPGRTLQLSVLREGKTRRLACRLAAHPKGMVWK